MRRAFLSGLSLALGLLAGAAAAAQAVHPSPADTRPLQAGSKVPAVRVESLTGGTVDLAELTRESGALLVFYRGGW